jgi:hypothetical protein
LAISNAVFGDDFGGAFNLNSNDKAFLVDSGIAVGIPEPTALVILAIALMILSRKKLQH